MHNIQKGVSEGICTGSKEYDEAELHDAMRAFLVNRGAEIEETVQKHLVLKCVRGVWQLDTQWHNDEHFEKFDYWSMTRAEEPSDPSTGAADKDVENAKFFVVTSRRSGFRRVHKIGGCGLDWRSCTRVQFLQELTANCADAVCKRCQRVANMSVQDTESSSSGSSSSTESDEEPFGNVNE